MSWGGSRLNSRSLGSVVGRRRNPAQLRDEKEIQKRAKAVSVDDIKAWILGQKGTFLLADVITGAGGSQATVRKAIDELIESGQVEKLGPIPNYTGRGRAPLQYNRS